MLIAIANDHGTCEVRYAEYTVATRAGLRGRIVEARVHVVADLADGDTAAASDADRGEFASVEEEVKVGVLSPVVPDGPESIVVDGRESDGELVGHHGAVHH